MNVLIVDDEEAACARLAKLVEAIPGWHNAGRAGNGVEALQKASSMDIDAVLMDIRLPLMNGIETARKMAVTRHAPAIIFTTAYHEHAIKAFELQAAGYLLKPVRLGKLEAALAHVRAARGSGSRMVADDAGGFLCCRVGGGIDMISTRKILYCRSENKYTGIHHEGGVVLTAQSLNSIEKEHGDIFVRTHRNTLINPAYIDGLHKEENGKFVLTFANSSLRLHVSRRCMRGLRTRLRALLGEPYPTRRRVRRRPANTDDAPGAPYAQDAPAAGAADSGTAMADEPQSGKPTPGAAAADEPQSGKPTPGATAADGPRPRRPGKPRRDE